MSSILFVDDDRRILDGLRRLLSWRRKSWSLQFVESGAEALALLARAPCDVVVSDMRMPNMDGAELLGRVQELHPQILRVVLSGSPDLETAVRAATVAHRFMSKPCEPPEMLASLDGLLELCQSTPPELLRQISAARCLPATTAHHQRVAMLLSSQHGSLESVAYLIERDAALAAQLQHLMSTDFFGRPSAPSTVRYAAAQLGIHVLRALFDAGALCSAPTPMMAARIERRNRHAVRVAHLCDLMTRELFAGGYLTGLIHDVGAWLDESEPKDDDDCQASGGASSRALLTLWGLPPSSEPLAQAVRAAGRLVSSYERASAVPVLDGDEAAWCARVPDWREQLERLDSDLKVE